MERDAEEHRRACMTPLNTPKPLRGACPERSDARKGIWGVAGGAMPRMEG